MDPFNHTIKNIRFFMFITTFVLLVLTSACKNDDEVAKEQLPVFGTCQVVSPKGNLNIVNSNSIIFEYKTSGGGKIEISKHFFTFMHDDYPNFVLEFWGGISSNSNVSSFIHENLNGKHIKDRFGDRRSIVFPDGSKITIVYAENFGVPLCLSIYDGNKFHRINLVCNILEYSSSNSLYTKQLDDMEADGETATIEFTETGLLFLNIYIEDVMGQKLEERVPLGEIFKDNPNKVDDYYDDPRIGHT